MTVGTGYTSVSSIAVDAAGDVFITDASPFVNEILPGGSTRSIGSGFTYPAGVAVDQEGDVFVGDHGNSAVKEVLPSGTILTLDPSAGFSFPMASRWTAWGMPSSPTPNNWDRGSSVRGDVHGGPFFHRHDGDRIVGPVDRPDTRHHLLRPRRPPSTSMSRRYSSSFTTTPVTTTTTTTLTSSSNPAFLGQRRDHRGGAKATPGFPTPTGSVSFYDNGTALDSSPIPLDGTGTAVLTTLLAALGTHPITAVYSGDPYNVTSTSSTLNESVASVLPTMTTLASSAGTVYAGRAVPRSRRWCRRACRAGHRPGPSVTFLDNGVLINALARPPRCHGHRRLHHIVALGGNERDHRRLPGRPVPRGVVLVAAQ